MELDSIVAGLLGLLTAMLSLIGWVVRCGMERVGKAVEASTRSMTTLAHTMELRHKDVDRKLDHLAVSAEAMRQQHAEGHKLCRFTSENVIDIKHAAAKTLRGGTTTEGGR